MKRFGLIGNPVAGSLSPRLFEAAYGGRYAYDLMEGAVFDASWQRFLDGYDGINITAPFKQDAFRAVDVLSDSARLCGAVNLAVKTPDGVVGYNTDVDGVILSVREALSAGSSVIPGLNPPVIPGTTGDLGTTGNLGTTGDLAASGDVPPLREALVIGCGGAGRAAAVAALRLGCRVTLTNRTAARAASLASELGCAWAPLEALAGTVSPDIAPQTDSASLTDGTSLIDSASFPPTTGGVSPDLVIYTVPGPMEGLPEFPDAVILEANYRTPCLEGHGRTYISGRRWLLYQAVAGYSIFTGEEPDRDAMLRIFC